MKKIILPAGMLIFSLFCSSIVLWAMGSKPVQEEAESRQELKGLREHLAERPVETRAVQIEKEIIETDVTGSEP